MTSDQTGRQLQTAHYGPLPYVAAAALPITQTAARMNLSGQSHSEPDCNISQNDRRLYAEYATPQYLPSLSP